MRQRGAESWQLWVFAGRDPVTGRKRWTTKTVRGGKREAQRALAAMIADVDRGVPGTDATLAMLTSHRWRRARNRAGLDGARLHDLRH